MKTKELLGKGTTVNTLLQCPNILLEKNFSLDKPNEIKEEKWQHL